MAGFLEIILSFPVVPLTVLMGIVVCYWTFVIIGVIGFEPLDGSTEGAAKAAGEAATGAIKAAGDAASGALKALSSAKGIEAPSAGHDFDVGAVKAVKGLVEDASLLSWLGLGKVPITVASSAVVFFSWFLSVLGMTHLAPLFGEPPGALVRVGVLGLALVAAIFASSLALRPFHRLFQTSPAFRRETEVLGRVCTVTSGRVDATFGTATFNDGGAGLNLHVVCAKKNELKKGAQAVILSFDPVKDVYEVEPVDWLLPEEVKALDDPARAALVAAARARSR